MRRLLFVIIAVAAAWSGYWFYGSYQMRQEIERYFEQQFARGWQADYQTLRVQGYPNRFDTILTDIVLTDTENQVQWQIPRLESFMLSYNWKHRIFSVPSTITVARPTGQITSLHDQLRVSLNIEDLKTQELNRIIAEGQNMRITPKGKETLTIKQLNFALEADQNAPRLYRLGLNLNGLDHPSFEAGRLGNTFQLDAFLRFDRPLDHEIWRGARPQFTQVDLRQMSGALGDAVFDIAGTLDVDEAGWPEGEITLRVEKWKPFARSIMQEALPADSQDEVDAILAAVSLFLGNNEDLDIPLRLRNRKILLGIFPLGDAPNLRLP